MLSHEVPRAPSAAVIPLFGNRNWYLSVELLLGD